MSKSEPWKLFSLIIIIIIKQTTTSVLRISHINYLVVTGTHPSMRAHEPHNQQNSQALARSQHKLDLVQLKQVLKGVQLKYVLEEKHNSRMYLRKYLRKYNSRKFSRMYWRKDKSGKYSVKYSRMYLRK